MEIKLLTLTDAIKAATEQHEQRAESAWCIQDGTFAYLHQCHYVVDCATFHYDSESEYVIDVYEYIDENGPDCFNYSYVSEQASGMKQDDYKLLQRYVFDSVEDAKKALCELIAQNTVFDQDA